MTASAEAAGLPPPWLPRAGLAVTVPLVLIALAYAGALVVYNGFALAVISNATAPEPRDDGLLALFLAANLAAAFAVWSAATALWRFAQAARGRPSRARALERIGLGLAALYFGVAAGDALLRERADLFGLAATLLPAALSLAALVLLNRLRKIA